MLEKKLGDARKHRTKLILQVLIGFLIVIAVGALILLSLAYFESTSPATQTASTLGLLAGGIGGAILIGDSFRTSEEANVHRDTLNELGKSVDLEFAPKVIAFNKKSVELTGNAKEQFMQWRIFLQKIYSEEKTPDVQL